MVRPMPKKQLPNPTKSEMAILRVIWQDGPSTVRTVHRQLSAKKSTGFTTVLKLMQIMLGKGILSRTEDQRPHLYSEAAPAEATQRQVVKDLMDRVFGGSAQKLVLHALSAKESTADELAEIRKVLDELEKGSK